MADAGPDGLMSAPPGVDQDAGSDSTIAATVEAAKTAGMAHVMEIEQATHTAGESIGDVMPLPAQPVATADASTDVGNLILFQGSLAQYAKRDEQIRTLGNLVTKLVG